MTIEKDVLIIVTKVVISLLYRKDDRKRYDVASTNNQE
jgi:hypothetical protein